MISIIGAKRAIHRTARRLTRFHRGKPHDLVETSRNPYPVVNIPLSDKSTLLVVALAVLLAGAFMHLRGNELGGAAMPGMKPAASVARPSGDIAPRGNADLVPVTAPGSTGADKTPDLETADDLYLYAQSLAPAQRAGDARAAWTMSRIYDYCAGYAMSPTGYAGDTRTIARMNMPAAVTLVAARERVGRRCVRFVPGDRLSRDAVIAMRLTAARAGSLAAEAALLALGQPLSESDEYKTDLVERVRTSRDPEAYAALAPAMGANAVGQEAELGEVSGTPFAELAWQLAACELGLDCGAESVLMTSYCANGGICSRDAAQDFSSFVFDAAVPRQSAEKVNEMVGFLLYDEGGAR